jgi:hypothetical protein
MGILRARIRLLRAKEERVAREASDAEERAAAARRAAADAARARPPLPQPSSSWAEVAGDADLLARWHERAWGDVRDAWRGGGGGGGQHQAPSQSPSPSSPVSVTSSFDFGDDAFY